MIASSKIIGEILRLLERLLQEEKLRLLNYLRDLRDNEGNSTPRAFFQETAAE